MLAAIKAKDVDTHNTEPAFLLGGFTSPMLWDRLAESSLKSNAVNSSVLGRKKTQGTAVYWVVQLYHQQLPCTNDMPLTSPRVCVPQERRTKQRTRHLKP